MSATAVAYLEGKATFREFLTCREPLTKEQWNNFDIFMKMTNDDKSAEEVDIGPAVERRIREIRERGTYIR